MLQALRQRNFALLWLGQFISITGDWVLGIALPFYVYQVTGSVLASGTMFVAEGIPPLFLGSLAGVFVDRWDRRRTMIAADLGRALVLLLVLAVRSRDRLWLIYPVAFLEATMAQFFNPARNALIPRLVGEDRLMAANSLSGLADNLARLLGPAIGGALLGLVGLTSVVLLDVASFLVSALMIALMAVPATRAEVPAAPATVGGVCQDLVAGLRVIMRSRLLTSLFLVVAIVLLADSGLSVVHLAFVDQVLHGGALERGWLWTARGLGGLAGGLLVAQVGGSWQPKPLIVVGLATMGVVYVAMAHIPRLGVALALMALMGVAVVAWTITGLTLAQRSVPDRFRGRVFGAYGNVIALMSLTGMGLGTALGDSLGPALLFDAAGLVTLAAGVLAWLLLPAGGSQISTCGLRCPLRRQTARPRRPSHGG